MCNKQATNLKTLCTAITERGGKQVKGKPMILDVSSELDILFCLFVLEQVILPALLDNVTRLDLIDLSNYCATNNDLMKSICFAQHRV